MPAPIVSLSLLNAHALPTDGGRPHLQPGNHLRIAHHPLLGLPCAPFFVSRARFESIQRLARRTNVLWVDSKGRFLTPPFAVTPDNPVTAYIVRSQGQSCVWAEVFVERESGPGGGIEFPAPGILRPDFPLDVVGTDPLAPIRGRRSGASILEEILGGNRGRLIDIAIDPDRFRLDDFRVPRRNALRVEGFLDSPYGPSFFAARETPRFAFSGPGIVALKITGSGTVSGLLWLEKDDFERAKFAFWRALHLPHDGGPRYVSVSNAENLCRERTKEAAPRRKPIQETLSVAGPAAAPLQTETEELDRVLSLTAPLETDIDRLIGDLSASQFGLGIEEALSDAGGTERGRMSTRLLQRVLQASLDPGVASYLGYFTRDKDFPEGGEEFVFYLVEGYFRRPRRPKANPGREDPHTAFHALLDSLPEESLLADANLVRQEVRERLEQDGGDGVSDAAMDFGGREDGPFIKFSCVAVADMSAPPLPPRAPRFDGYTDRGWLPAPISETRRQVELDVSGALTAGLLAAERREAGSDQSLNASNGDGFHLPLSLSLPNSDEETSADSLEPGAGQVYDPDAGPEQLRYSICQQDRFGRWSAWARLNVPPGQRPGPPQPALQAFYDIPAIAEPMPLGTVRLRVPVPELDSLPPGGRALAALDYEVHDVTGGSPGISFRTSSEVLPDPMSPPGFVNASFPGPLLGPTETRKLRIVARWRDTSGALSIESIPALLTLRDPRPPTQIEVPNTLLYAARPDVQGRALVEWQWAPVPGQDKIAVYYTDENRLTGFLEEAAGTNATARTALDAINAAASIADRAAVFRANAGLFKAFLFERLDLFPESVLGGQLRFQHYLSGSLKVLSFYRLSAETDNASRVPMETLPLICFGVPNSEPPAKPLLDVVADGERAPDHVAKLVVRISPGLSAPESIRVRRSSLNAEAPFMMPVVKEVPISSIEVNGFAVSEISDDGPLVIAPTASIEPWVRYFWVAEVQGGVEPGSSVSGRWSEPSDPATYTFIPPNPPLPPVNPNTSGTPVGTLFTDVVVTFETGEAMNGGEIGPYVLRLYRQLPGESMELFTESELFGEGPHEVAATAAGDELPLDTRFRLVIVDPLGRTSPPVVIGTISP